VVGPTMPSESVQRRSGTRAPRHPCEGRRCRRRGSGPLTVRLIVKPHDLLHAAHGVAGASPLDLDDEPGPRPRADDAVRPRGPCSAGTPGPRTWSWDRRSRPPQPGDRARVGAAATGAPGTPCPRALPAARVRSDQGMRDPLELAPRPMVQPVRAGPWCRGAQHESRVRLRAMPPHPTIRSPPTASCRDEREFFLLAVPCGASDSSRRRGLARQLALERLVHGRGRGAERLLLLSLSEVREQRQRVARGRPVLEGQDRDPADGVVCVVVRQAVE
jgi:hypothetical protein